jgi:Domain of unknown function (DUF4404)
MDREKLQQLLEDLHRELSATKSVDPASRKLLEQLLRDISKLTGPEPVAPVSSPALQLREAALRLEAEHPKLATALGQLGDALAKLGI